MHQGHDELHKWKWQSKKCKLEAYATFQIGQLTVTHYDAEAGLAQAVRSKKPWAIKFVLSTVGSSRGYTKTLTVEVGNDTAGVVIILPHNGRDDGRDDVPNQPDSGRPRWHRIRPPTKTLRIDKTKVASKDAKPIQPILFFVAVISSIQDYRSFRQSVAKHNRESQNALVPTLGAFELELG